jgi:flagellar motor switch protein FliN
MNDDSRSAESGAAESEEERQIREMEEAQRAEEEARKQADSGAEKAQFEQLDDDAGPAHGDVNLDVILDVPVTLSMEVGRTQISIRNLLQLNQGSVIELDRTAGEPLDVYVNGTLVAHGEVVVVNDKFGIRLTDVISPSERIKNLK